MLAILLESGNIEILRSFDEKCQQLMNAIGVENYIAPHRHLLDPKSECLIAVRALFTAVIFSDNGIVEKIEFFGTEKFKNLTVGLELPTAAWHTVVALTQGSVLFEVKEGPFDAKKAKEFAPWAPSEGSADAHNYLRRLRALCKQRLLESSGERTFEAYVIA